MARRRSRHDPREGERGILVSQLRVLAAANRREAHTRAWLDRVADNLYALADLIEKGDLEGLIDG